MADYDIEPTFTTARGHVREWFDHARQLDAWWRYSDAFASHGGIGGSDLRRQLSDDDLRQMAAQQRTVDVVVAMPNLVREVESWNGTHPGIPDDHLRIFNPHEHLNCVLDGDRVTAASAQPTFFSLCDDLGTIDFVNDSIDSYEALALLQPRFFLHGWKPTADPRTIDHFGMPTREVRMQRVIPFSNWRMLGHHFNPNIFDMAEAAEFVIHREQGVILEWRALVDGEPYERYWFTSVAFDVPVDPALFNRSGIPADVVIELEPELPWGA